MSFSINNAKVEELLDASNGEGVLPASTVTENTASFYPSYAVGGDTYVSLSLVTTETIERLMSLRKKIEGSGIPLVSADELDSEISEMRR